MFSNALKKLIVNGINGDMNAFHEFRMHCRAKHYYVDCFDDQFLENILAIISCGDFFESAETGDLIKRNFLNIALKETTWNKCPLIVLQYICLIISTTELGASELERSQTLMREGFVNDYKNGIYDSRFLYVLSLLHLYAMPVFTANEVRVIRRLLPITKNMTPHSAAILNCFQHSVIDLPIDESITALITLAENNNIDAIFQLIDYYYICDKKHNDVQNQKYIVHWLNAAINYKEEFSQFNNHQYLTLRFMLENHKNQWPEKLAMQLPDISSNDILLLVEQTQLICSTDMFECLGFYIQNFYQNNEFNDDIIKLIEQKIEKYKQLKLNISPKPSLSPSIDPKTFLSKHPGILNSTAKAKPQKKRKFDQSSSVSNNTSTNITKKSRHDEKHSIECGGMFKDITRELFGATIEDSQPQINTGNAPPSPNWERELAALEARREQRKLCQNNGRDKQLKRTVSCLSLHGMFEIGSSNVSNVANNTVENDTTQVLNSKVKITTSNSQPLKKLSSSRL